MYYLIISINILLFIYIPLFLTISYKFTSLRGQQINYTDRAVLCQAGSLFFPSAAVIPS